MNALGSLFCAGWPSFTLAAAALICMMTAVWRKEAGYYLTNGLAMLTYLVSGVGFGYQLWLGQSEKIGFLTLDPLSNGLGVLIAAIGLLILIFSVRYWRAQLEIIREVFPLLLFSSFGMTLMVATTHLLTFVLGLEVMSLSLYALVALRRSLPQSSEAAFKYFLLGSVASAFLLFGISFLYGVSGSLDLTALAQSSIPSELSLIFKMGVMFVLLGLAFKVAAVPFHFWAPDVYDGAPVPITGFMAAGVKVAAFGAFVRVLQSLVTWEALSLSKLLLGLSLATMLVGSLTALRQKSLKRILAYSSISHAGYLLLGLATLVAGGEWHAESVSAILYYLAVYSLLSLGIFGILTWWSSEGKEIGTLEDLKGLSRQHPVMSAFLAVFLISLAGIPPFAGFFAKYYLFSQAIRAGFYWPAGIGIVASAISLYYYLAPVVRMYFDEPNETATKHAKPMLLTGAALGILILLAVYLGTCPEAFLKVTRHIAMF